MVGGSVLRADRSSAYKAAAFLLDHGCVPLGQPPEERKYVSAATAACPRQERGCVVLGYAMAAASARRE